jgi:hypothetical protein
MDTFSSGSSDSSSSSDDFDGEIRNRIDEFGRPVARPQFQPCGESQVLARAKEFLPLFREATFRLIEPDMVTENSTDIRLSLDELHTASEDTDSENSFGVEIDVGLGVFDVNGAIEDSVVKQAGIPIVELHLPLKPEILPSNTLIQVVDSPDTLTESE